MIGTIIHGTHQPRDLIPAFRAALIELSGEAPGYEGQGPCEYIAHLEDLLNEYAPAYCYFGAHQGDGSDFGFWTDDESLWEATYDGALVTVDDTSDMIDPYMSYLHVNDHGNMTLYAPSIDAPDCWAAHVEVWSIV
jgi:hypothetical protein